MEGLGEEGAPVVAGGIEVAKDIGGARGSAQGEVAVGMRETGSEKRAGNGYRNGLTDGGRRKLAGPRARTSPRVIARGRGVALTPLPQGRRDGGEGGKAGQAGRTAVRPYAGGQMAAPTCCVR